MRSELDSEALAVATLREVCMDPKAPAAARAAAARALLELEGRLGRHAAAAREDQPLEEMSASDLAQELERIRGTKRGTKR